MHSLSFPISHGNLHLLLILLLLAFTCKANVWDDYYQWSYDNQRRLNDYFQRLGEYYFKMDKYKSPSENEQQIYRSYDRDRVRVPIRKNDDRDHTVLSKEKQELLDLHNKYRRRVANGQVNGQPPSNKIRDLVSFLHNARQ